MPKTVTSTFVVLLGLSLSLRAGAEEPPAPPDANTTTTSTPEAAPSPPAQPQAGEGASVDKTALLDKPTPIVGLRVDGGYALREMMSLSMTGAGVGIGAGMQVSEHLALWGASRLFLGSTESGLPVRSVNFGGEVELVLLTRLRLGAGLNAFLIGVDRVTRDKTILSWGPGLTASARGDVIQAKGFVIFARAGIDAGYEIYNSSIFWGPTFGAGVDFDLKGSRAGFK